MPTPTHTNGSSILYTKRVSKLPDFPTPANAMQTKEIKGSKDYVMYKYTTITE